MPTYTLNIINNNNNVHSYYFFTSPPAAGPGSGQVFANVWIKSTPIGSPNAQYTVSASQDLFAVCGTLPQKLSPGVVVQSYQWDGPVTLNKGQGGTSEIVSVVEGGAIFNLPAKTTANVEQSAFQINTEPFDSQKNPGIFVGMARYNNNNKVTPVAVWSAQGAQQYSIRPTPKFYVATGSFQIKQAVDLKTIGATGVFDFDQAGEGETVATVTHNPDGTYSKAVYSSPDSTSEV